MLHWGAGQGGNWCQGFSGGATTICWDFLFSLPPWQGVKLTRRLTQLLLLRQIGNILEYCCWGASKFGENNVLFLSPTPLLSFLPSCSVVQTRVLMPARQGLDDLATSQTCPCFSLEIISCIEGLTLSVAEDDFELPILLSLLQCWDYRGALPFPVYMMLGTGPRTVCLLGCCVTKLPLCETESHYLVLAGLERNQSSCPSLPSWSSR